MRIEQPYSGRRFRSFNEYRGHLADAISSIIVNGKARERKQFLNPTVGISRGYGLPAVAALVREFGTTETITLSVNVNGMDDFGAEIAGDLGLRVEEFSHGVADVIDNLDQVELRHDQIEQPANLSRLREWAMILLLRASSRRLTVRFISAGLWAIAFGLRALICHPMFLVAFLMGGPLLNLGYALALRTCQFL